jgi:hypothetical protein
MATNTEIQAEMDRRNISIFNEPSPRFLIEEILELKAEIELLKGNEE